VTAWIGEWTLLLSGLLLHVLAAVILFRMSSVPSAGFAGEVPSEG